MLDTRSKQTTASFSSIQSLLQKKKALLVLLCKADEVPVTKMNPSMVVLRPIDCLSIHSASFQAVMPAQGTLLHQNMAAFLSFTNEMAQSKTILQRYLSFPQRNFKLCHFYL